MTEKQKILIVDDKKENLVALRQVLGDLDAEVIEATTGNEALAATLEHDFAVAILDVMMPEMDGYELAGHLRGDKKTQVIPIVFLTAALPDERHMFKGYEAGGIDYITKPYLPEVMVSKVNVLLEMDRNRRKLQRHRDELEALVAERTVEVTKRAKEIKCLQTISSLVAEPRETVEETLEDAVELIPPGWQYPEITCARVVFENRESVTANFKETPWRQSASVDLSGQAVGRVDVFYLEEKPEAHEGPFLGEERELIIDIARQLGVMIQRKRAEEALRESETHLQGLFETMAEGMIFIAPDGQIVQANPAAERILGLKHSDIEARNCVAPEWEILRPDGTPMPPEEMAGPRAMKERRPVKNMVMGVKRPDDSISWINVNAAPRMTESGEFGGVVGTFVDITEQKRAKAEREKLNAQLAQAQKLESIGRLAGGVAHDFNNMLGVILGRANMILEEMDSEQPFHAGLTEIKKAGERSANLTRQLLAFARKQTVAPKVLDLNQTVADMLKMLHRLIGEDIDMAWIPGEAAWPVKIDPAQIDQILANLCVNARDAIADVGKVTIETGNMVFDEEYCKQHAGFVPGEYTLLAVSDNGCGMDAETLENVFEPFFTTKESNQGTGLGLATVYGAVKQNNGFINVYSEPDQGTTFKIYLPRHAARAAQTKQPRTQAAERGSETILLVEDERAILKMVTIMLEQSGYKVLAAATPGEAIALAREYTGKIHLLMTDVVMPEMNGRDLAKNILSLYPGLKRVFMSGYTANVIAQHGVLDEDIHFIQKPFSKGDLTAKVREALED